MDFNGCGMGKMVTVSLPQFFDAYAVQRQMAVWRTSDEPVGRNRLLSVSGYIFDMVWRRCLIYRNEQIKILCTIPGNQIISK